MSLYLKNTYTLFHLSPLILSLGCMKKLLPYLNLKKTSNVEIDVLKTNETCYTTVLQPRKIHIRCK